MRHHDRPTPVRLRAGGVDLTVLGDRPQAVSADEDGPAVPDEEVETLRFEDPAGGRYARLTLVDDRVREAILLGLPDAAATITQLHDCGGPAPTDRLALLFGRALPAAPDRAAPAGPALVCRCNGVTGDDLAAAWQAGAADVEALCRRTRATAGCGDCHGRVAAIAEQLAAG